MAVCKSMQHCWRIVCARRQSLLCVIFALRKASIALKLSISRRLRHEMLRASHAINAAHTPSCKRSTNRCATRRRWPLDALLSLCFHSSSLVHSLHRTNTLCHSTELRAAPYLEPHPSSWRAHRWFLSLQHLCSLVAVCQILKTSTATMQSALLVTVTRTLDVS